MKILFAVLFVLVLNIPFGYWRSNVKRFSLEWAFAIHIPVPFIIAFRIFTDLGWEFYTYPILISAFLLGQFIGGKIFSFRKRTDKSPLTSCLVWDVVKESQRKR
jgi:hypothetical protein